MRHIYSRFNRFLFVAGVCLTVTYFQFPVLAQIGDDVYRPPTTEPATMEKAAVLDATTVESNQFTKDPGTLPALEIAGKPGTFISLGECLEKALARNLDISAESEAYQAVKAQARESVSSIKPQIKIQNTYTRLGKVTEFGGRALGDKEIAISKVGLTQPVYSFGRLQSGIKALQEQTKASQEQFEARRIDVFLRVIRAFFETLKSRNRIAFAQENLLMYEKHMELAETLLKNGVVVSTDVSTTKVKVLEARQKILEEKNEFRLSRLNLANLLQLPLEELPPLQEPPNLQAIMTTALGSGTPPEIKGLKHVITMQQSILKATDKGNYPILLFQGGWESGTQFQEEAKNWNANLILDFPIFDSGVTKAKRQQAFHTLAKSKRQLESLQQNFAMAAQRSSLKMKELQEKFGLAQEALATARENLDHVKVNYREGTALNTDVLEAQLLLLNAQNAVNSAFYDYIIHQSEYSKNSGTLDGFVQTLINSQSSDSTSATGTANVPALSSEVN